MNSKDLKLLRYHNQLDKSQFLGVNQELCCEENLKACDKP